MKRRAHITITDVGRRLNDARERLYLSRRELATAAGVSDNFIGLIEDGLQPYPRINAVERIAAALEVDPAWLAFGRRTR